MPLVKPVTLPGGFSPTKMQISFLLKFYMDCQPIDINDISTVPKVFVEVVSTKSTIQIFKEILIKLYNFRLHSVEFRWK
jgi:hypothetical protein